MWIPTLQATDFSGLLKLLLRKQGEGRGCHREYRIPNHVWLWLHFFSLPVMHWPPTNDSCGKATVYVLAFKKKMFWHVPNFNLTSSHFSLDHPEKVLVKGQEETTLPPLLHRNLSIPSRFFPKFKWNVLNCVEHKTMVDNLRLTGILQPPQLHREKRDWWLKRYIRGMLSFCKG